MINATRYRLDAEINRQAGLAREIAKLQAQIATQKRIQAPSDDPIGNARVAEIGRVQADEEAWLRNVGTAADLASDGYVALSSLMTAFDRAAEQVRIASTGTSSDEARAIAAKVLAGIVEEITTLSETRDMRGEPLFRATASLEIPVGPGIRITPVATREAVFGPIDTADGPQELADIVRAAAVAAAEKDPGLREATLRSALAAITAASSHVALMRGDQNIRGGRIAGIQEQLLDSDIRLSEQRADIEATDIPETIAKLEAAKLSLEAAQAVFARVNEKTLFDYLR